MIDFIIPGKPQGKGRPRFASRGKYVHAYTPKATEDYERYIIDCWRQWCGEAIDQTAPTAIRIDGMFPIPKSTSKKKRMEMLGTPHTKKPDADNLAKAVLDALNGVAYHDDAQITYMVVTKQYAEEPCVRVRIWRADEDPD